MALVGSGRENRRGAAGGKLTTHGVRERTMAQGAERKFGGRQGYQWLSRRFKQFSLLDQLYNALMIGRAGIMVEPVMELPRGAKNLEAEEKHQHQEGNSLPKTQLRSPFIGSSH